MRKIFFTTILIVLALSRISLAQMDTLNKKLQAITAKYSLVGMSVSVTKNDSVVFAKGYGLKDIARNLATDDKTAYRIASISKTFAAAALMTLYDKGKFKLDDDISTCLGYTLRNPNFPNDVITFRKVLSHTASLRDGTGYDSFLGASYSSNPPNIKALLVSGGAYYTADMWSSSQAPANSYFQYANINFGLVGTLVEKLANERFDLYCRRTIFVPLGLDGSYNVRDLTNINNVAVLYKSSGSSWVVGADNYGGVRPDSINLSAYVPGTNGAIFAPQGGVRISAADLARFMLMLQKNGIYNGVRILSDSSAQIMKRSVWISNGSNGNNYYGIFNQYGLGISATADLLPGENLMGHPGEAYGLISDMYFSTVKNYGITFITNGGRWGNGAYSGWYNVEEEIYKEALKAINNEYAPQDTAIFRQDFESITNSGDTLQGWKFNNAQTWKLTGYGHNSDKYAGWDETHNAEHWISTPKIANPGTLYCWLAAYNNSSSFDLKIQVSTDGITWTDKGTFKSKGAGGDIGLDFVQKSATINLQGSYFIRFTTANLLSGGFYLDDIALTAAPPPPPDSTVFKENFEAINASGDTISGWKFNNAQTWKLTGYGHNSDKYAGWDETHNAEHWISTPKITNPGTLYCWLAAYNNSSSFDLKIQVSTDGITWTDKGAFKSKGAGGDIGLDFVQKSATINLQGSYFIRFATANLLSGGFYLDDVAVTPSPAPPDTASFRENFESVNASGDTLPGWKFNNAQTWKLTGYGHNSDKYAGWDETHNADHWITSPKVTNPGVLWFWAAAYNNSSNFELKVQVSTDGNSWTDKGTFKSKGAGGDIGLDFIQKSINLNLTGNYFIRWSTAAWVSGGFYLDDIVVTKIITAVQDNSAGSLTSFSLSQNYPNPFNPSTVIKYQVAAGSIVSLKIYTMLGQEVKTLVNEYKQPGEYEARFNASGLSSGIYICKYKAGQFSKSIKMSFIK